MIPMARFRPDVIKPEALRVPQYVWAVMGALDALTGAMQSLALSKLQAEGGLVVLLMQSAIPLSMLITRLCLRTKYGAHHYVGAGVVVAGIVVALVPKVSAGPRGGEPEDSAPFSPTLIAYVELL